MRTYSCCLLLFLLVACFSPLMAQQPAPNRDTSAGQRKVEDQIVALEKRLWNGDANNVSKLEAEDYEVIKHAHRYHRADDEAAAKEANFSLVSMDDIDVRVLRPDVALLTYHAIQKGSR